jgi:hypothetical protein
MGEGYIYITGLQQPKEPSGTRHDRSRLLAAPSQFPVRRCDNTASSQVRCLINNRVVARAMGQDYPRQPS